MISEKRNIPYANGNGFGENETFIFVVTLNVTLLEGIEVLQHGSQAADGH